MSKLSQRQQFIMREAFARQVRLIATLPLDQRQSALNESLKLLDNAISFEFDSYATNGSTQATLDELANALGSLKVPGQILVVGYLGRFCLDATKEEPILASDTTRISACKFSLGRDYALALGQKLSESVRFHLRRRGIDEMNIVAVSLCIENNNLQDPSTGYAKSWNLIARHNNQVRIRIENMNEKGVTLINSPEEPVDKRAKQ
jgi:outer membrane protein OmpA-like peptidoglycan-associated protein